jgi:2-phospho-L-lactate/phosphoenolpyruvate guanylyltransferase
MRYILIPVKDLSRAKQRLAAVLTQAERTQLAWALLENTFAATAQTRNADRIAVVTLYQPAIELAEKFSFEVVLEREQISESASVDFGSKELLKRGAEAVLRLPIDLPLIKPEDIEIILDQDGAAPSAVIVPSRDSTGTNAMLRRPPDLFPSHFGAHSLSKHLAEAEKAKARCRVLELPRIALDVDEPADLAELLKQSARSSISELLQQFDLPTRLALAGH